MSDIGNPNIGKKGGVKPPSRFAKFPVPKKPNINDLFWVGQGFYGLWQNAGGGYTGLATHSLQPCVGLALTGPNFCALTHLDSDFHDNQVRRNAALRNIVVGIGLVHNRNAINAYIYADIGANGDPSSRMIGLFIYAFLRGILNPANVNILDKQAASGLMIVRFNDLSVVRQPDWFGLPALENQPSQNGGVRHAPIYQ